MLGEEQRHKPRVPETQTHSCHTALPVPPVGMSFSLYVQNGKGHALNTFYSFQCAICSFQFYFQVKLILLAARVLFPTLSLNLLLTPALPLPSIALAGVVDTRPEHLSASLLHS